MKSVLWLSAQILSLWMEHILRNRKNFHICTLIHMMRTAVMQCAKKKSKVSLHCKQQWKRYRIFWRMTSETERSTLRIPLSPPVWHQASIEDRQLWGWQQLPQILPGRSSCEFCWRESAHCLPCLAATDLRAECVCAGVFLYPKQQRKQKATCFYLADSRLLPSCWHYTM